MSPYAKGLLLTGLGVLIITPDALLLRLITADPWTVLVYRGLGFFSVQALIVVHRYGAGTLAAAYRTGGTGLLLVGLFACGQCLFVLSITYTAVANTLVIIAATPLMAALLAWLMLGEAVRPRTLVAGAIGFAAVGLIFLSDPASPDIGSPDIGATDVAVASGLAGSRAGDMAAVATMMLLALVFTLLRRCRDRDMLPAVASSGFLTFLVALAMCDTLMVLPGERLWLVLLVLIVSPVSFALISTGPRYLPAPEVSLLLLLETALGPLWVWWAIGEEPATTTLLGGLVLLGVLAANALLGLRERSR